MAPVGGDPCRACCAQSVGYACLASALSVIQIGKVFVSCVRHDPLEPRKAAAMVKSVCTEFDHLHDLTGLQCWSTSCRCCAL